MLKSGKEHLEGLRDGRTVYIGREKVTDVTSHPAFKNAAHTVANMYDAKRDPANLDTYSFEENGERYSTWYLQAKTRDDLRKRMNCHKALADLTHGMMGRSPDHVSGFVTGMATNPAAFDTDKYKFGANLSKYYEFCKRRDIFSTYAVLPPQAARNPEFYVKQNIPVPTLQVVAEKDDGIVISGMKMLATSAVFCDEIWIGNLLPLAPDQVKQAVTCAIPVNTPGLSLWSRQSLEWPTRNAFDHPLAWRFDETDSMVMCDNVKVPWERVFVMDDAIKARAIYIETPAHCYGNHQSNVRYWSKLQLILGLASKITAATGANEVPVVRETLGRISALEAMLAGMIHGQIEAAEEWPKGYLTFNRRMMYAALNWCTESYSAIIDQLRELSGGGVFQMPASIDVMHDAKLSQDFARYWQTPQLGAVDRMKLFKIVWDMVGSEFAGRQQQYEKFYAGASFIVRNHSFRETDWKYFHKIVDDLMASYDIPSAADLDRRKREQAQQ
ncbi:MAG: 4-hydroxyphenylacetate 3-hydroxylase family protein [Alphaproteobacteria bacterium]